MIRILLLLLCVVATNPAYAEFHEAYGYAGDVMVSYRVGLLSGVDNAFY